MPVLLSQHHVTAMGSPPPQTVILFNLNLKQRSDDGSGLCILITGK